jgi:hypothetical protein
MDTRRQTERDKTRTLTKWKKEVKELIDDEIYYKKRTPVRHAETSRLRSEILMFKRGIVARHVYKHVVIALFDSKYPRLPTLRYKFKYQMPPWYKLIVAGVVRHLQSLLHDLYDSVYVTHSQDQRAIDRRERIKLLGEKIDHIELSRYLDSRLTYFKWSPNPRTPFARSMEYRLSRFPI